MPSLENEDSSVCDPCFGWVPIDELLMGDEEPTTGTAKEVV